MADPEDILFLCRLQAAISQGNRMTNNNDCPAAGCEQHFHRLEDHIAFLDKRMLEMFAATHREVAVTAATLEKRLDAGNHIREALKEQAEAVLSVLRGKIELMLPRSEHDIYIKQVEADLRILRESRAELAGKASQSSMNLALALALIGALSGLLALVIKLVKL